MAPSSHRVELVTRDSGILFQISVNGRTNGPIWDRMSENLVYYLWDYNINIQMNDLIGRSIGSRTGRRRELEDPEFPVEPVARPLHQGLDPAQLAEGGDVAISGEQGIGLG